jgi:hypothetical protein
LATIEEHLAQWRHNRAFLEDISPTFPDWMVTASLYLAIHAIEALLTADRAKARSRHQDRLEILQSERRYEHIYENFRVLYEICHVTRYSANPNRWVPSDQIEKRIIKGLVYAIEGSVRKLLAASKPPVMMPNLPPIRLRTADKPPVT